MCGHAAGATWTRPSERQATRSRFDTRNDCAVPSAIDVDAPSTNHPPLGRLSARARDRSIRAGLACFQSGSSESPGSVFWPLTDVNKFHDLFPWKHGAASTERRFGLLRERGFDQGATA